MSSATPEKLCKLPSAWRVKNPSMFKVPLFSVDPVKSNRTTVIRLDEANHAVKRG